MLEEFNEKIDAFSPYLDDLSRRLKVIVFCFILSFALGILVSTTLLKQVIIFFNFTDVTLNTSSPFQLFDLAIDFGMFIALLICIPIFIYHTYTFIKSALKKNERRAFFMLIPLSTLLFLLGFIYGFLILYSTIQLLADINVRLGIKNVWDISLFLSKIVSTSALLGLIFQFPIILSIFIRLDLIKTKYLKEKRRHAILGMFIFTSLLPPTDGISLLLMVLPLIVMYEFTIMYNRFSN
jgi:sec-independent protein translocase protein TatC